MVHYARTVVSGVINKILTINTDQPVISEREWGGNRRQKHESISVIHKKQELIENSLSLSLLEVLVARHLLLEVKSHVSEVLSRALLLLAVGAELVLQVFARQHRLRQLFGAEHHSGRAVTASSHGHH